MPVLVITDNKTKINHKCMIDCLYLIKFSIDNAKTQFLITIQSDTIHYDDLKYG